MAAFGSDAFRVDSDLERALTLPPQAFTDPDVLDREEARVFARSWQVIPDLRAQGAGQRPLSEQVQARGSRVPVTVLGRPLFLQRGWTDDSLAAFPNACTHAWHALVLGPSRGPSLTCPQHGRKFDCTGRYVSQPDFERSPRLARAEDDLLRLPVEERMGLLFTCLGDPAARLDDVVGPAARDASRLGPLVPRAHGSESREVLGNWKLHVWNYLDRLHLAHVHRAPGGLADAVDLASYRTEVGAWSVLQWAFAREAVHGFDPALVAARPGDADRRVFALWWFCFPNLALNFYPWGLSLNAWLPVPGAPDRTRFLWQHFVRDEALHARRDQTWLSAQVDAEDMDALAHVRAGLATGLVPRGRFAPGEEGPHWFHRRVSELLLD